MNTTQHALGQVLLHPACTTNPDAVKAVQQATGRLVVINGGKPQLNKPTYHFATGAVDFLPASTAARRFMPVDDFTTGPFGGDAA